MSVQSDMLIETLEAHKRGLLRFLRRRLGCPDAAHDVYQGLSEHLVTASINATVATPKAYLYRAAANAAHSYRRAAKTRLSYEAAAAAHRGDVEMRDPERVALGRDALQVVERALDELPLLTQRIFIAFRVNGEAQRDIAKRFGVSLSTVEKRIAKASAYCHRRLREAGFTAEVGGGRHSIEAKNRTQKTSV